MKLPKKLGWVYLLGVAVLIAAFLILRRESFGGYIEEQGKYIDAYTSNGPATYPLAEAVQRCNGMPQCLGVTQEPGGTGFSLRAQATMGSRAGAISYRKPANAWAAAGFSITPPAPAAVGGVAPYDNSKVYRVGDQVTLNGKTYRMVEGAGVAGYSPERPGDRLWQLVPAAAPATPQASYQDCVNAVEQTGFIPKVTWGSTPPEKRDPKCDALLCPYWKSKYSDMTKVPEQYKRSVADCGLPAAPTPTGPQPYDNGKTYTTGDIVTYSGKTYKMYKPIGGAGYAPPAFPQHWQEVDAAGNPVAAAAPPAVPNAAAPAVTGGPAPAPASTGGPAALQAPIGSATVMSGSPAPVPGPAAGQAPATIVIPAQTSPGTYLLRQVF